MIKGAVPFQNHEVLGGRRLPETRMSLDAYKQFLEGYGDDIVETHRRLDTKAFVTAVRLIGGTRGGRGQVFTAGNGGSAAIAEHFAHNLNWDTSAALPREQKLSARCFNVEGAEVTARANDRHHGFTFATQLENHVRPRRRSDKTYDIFVGISASGEADNVVKALAKAREMGVPSIYIGKPGSTASELATLNILTHSDDQQVIEDVTQSVTHMLVRALGVELGGNGTLQEDLAHLRGKVDGIRDMMDQQGAPADYAALTRINFAEALDDVVTRRIDASIRENSLITHLFEETLYDEKPQYTIMPLGADFTNFLRRVKGKKNDVVAKTGFLKTKARIIQEHADVGARGIVEVIDRYDPDIEAEYRRTSFLHKIFPRIIPEPKGEGDGVAFYQYIPGKTLDAAITAGEISIPFDSIGRTLREWHSVFEGAEVPRDLKNYTPGKLDRIDRFNNRFATREGIETAFNPLFLNGYLDQSEQEWAIDTLADASNRLKFSSVHSLPRNTLGHGDFKPENILLKDGEPNEFYFLDNDLHPKPAVVDVAKMVSRLTAIGLTGNVDPEALQFDTADFLNGYYKIDAHVRKIDRIGYTGIETIPYQQIADIMAMDLMAILASYSTISKKQLHQYPQMAQGFLSKPKEMIKYIGALTQTQHSDLSTIFAPDGTNNVWQLSNKQH